MNSDKKDEDAATKHVLDYYKKYSQNRELPKYFSGTSLSYLPEIKDVHSPEAEVKAVVKTGISIIVTSDEVNEEKEIVIEEFEGTSRASSAMSNHKLEWDSGADIGYGNCQEKHLRKSLSLPIISDLAQKKSETEFITSRPTVTNCQSSSTSDSNVKVVLNACTSSSEYHSDENISPHSSKAKGKEISSSCSSDVEKITHISTASSSDSSTKHSIKQFASTLLYLKQKIGLPGAHSTPKYAEGGQSDNDTSSTAMIKKATKSIEKTKMTEVSSKFIDDKMLKKTSLLTFTHSDEDTANKKTKSGDSDFKKRVRNYPQKKIINLALTKPITVECTCSDESLTSRPLQTLTKQSTVAVQTNEIMEQELNQIIQNSQKEFKNQSLTYMEYPESDNKTNACSTQTGSDVIESDCDSFEYLKKEAPKLKDNAASKVTIEDKSEVPRETDLVIQKQETNLKKTRKMSDLRITCLDTNSEPSSNSDLGNLMSTNMEHDIGKSVYVLQRLLKSKKYDPITKKRYIKKIVKKITESKYLEESSTSSDLFIPKKLIKTAKDTDSSGANHNRNSLQSNNPWYPAAGGEQIKLSPQRKKLVLKTFTQDFLPKRHSSREEVSSVPEIVPVHSRDTRKNRFTLTNNEFSVNHRYSTETSKSDKVYSEAESTSLEKNYESTSSSKSYHNWKEDKTLSEKILEKQSEEKSHSSNGNGDCLVKFADKERKFQISWINNEINHLGKLRGLLEKPNSAHSKRKTSPNIKKSTNIYTVSSKNDSEEKLKRNYIIETLLGTQSSSEMNFNLDGQVYTVEQYLDTKKRKETKGSKKVTGNIEVVSTDSTTNIKIRTFCEECKRSPCICVVLESEGCKCHLGETCGGEECICQNIPLEKVSSCKCQDLSRACLNKSMGSSDNSTCCICKKCPCVCDTKFNVWAQTAATTSKDDMTGTFIPVTQSRSTAVKYSTFPSTLKEDSERKSNITCLICCPKCEKYVCICKNKETGLTYKDISTGTKDVPLQRDQASGSLRNVFENCACTQTHCTCNFVEKLVNRFSRQENVSTTRDDKYMQTEKLSVHKSVGLQTEIDAKNKNEQTNKVNLDDKILQTEKPTTENQSIGIQTTKKRTNGIDIQTDVSKLDQNFNDMGIQAKADVKDQILQTISIEEQTILRNSVLMQPVSNEITRTKGVSFVDVSLAHSNVISSDCLDFNKQQDQSGSSIATVEKVRDQQNMRVRYNPNITHLGNISEQPNSTTVTKDASTSPTLPSSVSSSNNSRQQDATTSPLVHSTGTYPGNFKKRRDLSASQAAQSVSTSPDIQQEAAATQTIDRKSTDSHSDGSRKSSSKKSSHGKRKVLCVCCCTQTDSKKIGGGKGNANGQGDSSSDKENSKKRSESLTTTSTMYEICPSILASSYNDTSQSAVEETSSKYSTVCVCCKEKYPADKISLLGSKNETYALCCNCLEQRPILTAVCYAGPEENCPCKKPPSNPAMKTDTSDETKKMTTDSNDMEEYCTCTKPFQSKNSRYCFYCKFKLRNTARSKNGIAYTLTLETECLNKMRKRRKKIPLEEIKVKVPCPSSKKKYKDKANFSKKNGDTEKVCSCGKVLCTSNCHIIGVSSKHKKEKEKNGLSLQEYLEKNRPDFIESAETRRHVVLCSRNERETGRADAKLKFAEENMRKYRTKKPKKLFTEQEMKEITKRNYKKLPEVKEKINNVREQKLRSADRFITDIFARKIQRSVLKGKSSFPIDSNVICLPKTCNC